jgi:3-(3-hydroxy-phenyl)propionate hydroxylase
MFDVAIVGYGPAGVVAAGLLGQAGLSVYVCERLTEVYQIPRAIALDHEILRVFQQLDVADAVLPFCEPFTPSEFFGVDGQMIRRMTMVAPPYPQAHTPSMVFTQPAVEQVLRERVAQMPNVTVALGAEMTHIAQDADSVTLDVATGQNVQQVRARYALACDGGSSAVRTQLDMPLEDLDFDEPWLVVDVLVNERGLAKLPKVSVQYCEPDRPCTMVIGPKNHRRWEISLKPGEDPKLAATPEATWRLLSRWLTPEDGTLWRQSSYRFHALVAQRWRHGRVFLAGDAAHMQPPFLGQGMCQGVRDVANLAWKLIVVLRGDVGGARAEALLESYGTERKAHVRELTTRIKAVGAVICERDPVKARARDAALLAQCGGVVKDTPRQDILPRLDTGLLAQHDHPARGSLFPQPWLLDGPRRQRMDTVAGHGWRLVLSSGQAAPANAVGLPWLRAVALGTPGARETDGVVDAWFHRHGCIAALVRPDHYVYGVATSAEDLTALVTEWATQLGAMQTCNVQGDLGNRDTSFDRLQHARELMDIGRLEQVVVEAGRHDAFLVGRLAPARERDEDST